MKQRYEHIEFRADTLTLIEKLNAIVVEYQRAGYVLTVRQLYYQMVARGHIENTLRSYKRLASIANDARMAGLIDWAAIEDRTRDFVRQSRWSSGANILAACVSGYHQDLWEDQPRRMFVLVEKEALVGVLEPVCRRYDIPLLAARGYPSGTVLREFALSDLRPCVKQEQTPLILHLGDHDPSGIDMTRDLAERICTFMQGRVEGRLDGEVFKRIALNMPQIEELEPPENPAKTTDSRFQSYMAEFGESSWELDALPPDYLERLIREEWEAVVDIVQWNNVEAQIRDTKDRLQRLSDTWDDTQE